MTDVLDRPTLELSVAASSAAKSRLSVIDCDIHPGLNSTRELYPYLSQRWQDHLKTYAVHFRSPFTSTTPGKNEARS